MPCASLISSCMRRFNRLRATPKDLGDLGVAIAGFNYVDFSATDSHPKKITKLGGSVDSSTQSDGLAEPFNRY